MNNRTTRLRLLAGLLAICILCPFFPAVDVFADAGIKAPVEYTDGSVHFSVGMYFDADRTLLDTPLTAEGSTLSGWEYESATANSATRHLGISVAGLDQSKRYRIVIEMDPILYLDMQTDPVLTNTTMTLLRNDPITVNTNGSYVPATYSLKNLTYLLDNGAGEIIFGLPIRFTPDLWDKKNGSVLGNDNGDLLKFSLQEETSGGEFLTVGSSISLRHIVVSGSIPYTPSTSTYVTGYSTATNILGKTDTMRLVYSMFDSNALKSGHVIKDLDIRIAIPSCEVNGTKYTLPYSSFKLSTANGTPDITQEYDDEMGILHIKAKNVYFASHGLFQLYFTAPESLKSIPDNYAFSGSVSVTADGTKLSDRSLYIRLDTNEKAILKGKATSGNANVLENGTVQLMGTLAISNESAQGGSGSLWISLSFDTNNTNAVSVTTVNLMCDRDSKTIDIEYTLVDRDGNPALDGQTFYTSVVNRSYNPGSKVDNLYITFSRQSLPEEHRQYYFKTVGYSMGNLPGNCFAYHTGASSAPYSAGTFWGYVNVSQIPGTMPTHKMELYSVQGAEKMTVLQTTTRTSLNSGTSVSYGIEAPAVSVANTVAGVAVTVSGRVFVTSYPYTSNSCLDDIRLGVLLPKGLTLNSASVIATYGGNKKMEVKQVTSTSVSTTENLYIIEFVGGNKIGYYNELLEAMSNGSTLSFSFQINSDSTMSTQTIYLRECIFVAGYLRTNGAGGSYASNATPDIYDLNGNGSTSDKIGCFKSDFATSVTFVARPAQLNITDSLMNSSGVTGSSVPMESFADILNYRLQIKCIEGGSAKDFFYIIPVGKTYYSFESTFVETCDVELVLKGAVVVDNAQGTAMKVFYCFDRITSYADAVSNAVWYENLPSGKDWGDITAIRVVSSEDIIKNGSISTISLPLGYNGEQLAYPHLAGMKIRWSSRGYYHYTIGSNSSAGVQSTAGCTITLNYTPEEPIHFELTAAKGGEPLNGEKNYSFVLPQFILAQNYSMTEIKPSNVNLVDKGYNFTLASSADANQNFRIMVSVKNSAEDKEGSAPVAIAKDGTFVGYLPNETAPQFTFTIENADALSDIVTSRIVSLTLIGDNGVIVPVVITIRRELAAAEPTESAIVAGKVYSPFLDNTTSATVSADSAFTAQFITKYIPSNYKNLTLEFDHALTVGTIITMIDWTDSDNLKFYCYTVAGNQTSIPLESFKTMGSSSSYQESDSTDETLERMLFIIAFPECGEPLRENSVSLTKELLAGTDENEVPKLKFTTVAKREFYVSSSSTTLFAEEQTTITYRSVCDVTDSRYTGRNLSLVVSSADGSVLSADSYVKVDGARYYMTSLNTFLIPLLSAQLAEGQVTMSFHSEKTSSVTLEIELWASATAEGSKPMMGNMVATEQSLQIAMKEKPSLSVDSISDRVIYSDELQNALELQLSLENVEKITLECQRKVDASYVTQTAVVEAVNNIFNAESGVFTLGLLVDGKVSIRMSRLTASGTYRILLKAYSKDNVGIEIPINFVVLA